MLTIRKARHKDRESIWNVHLRAIQEVCSSHYSQKEIEDWSEVLKPTRYNEPIKRGSFYVAVDDNAIVGFGNLNQESGEIEAVYVAPEYVRRGVGREILKALESVARDVGLTVLRLSSSLNAVQFYENAGYRRQKQKSYLLPREMVACLPMVKELASPKQEVVE
jgi:GNAT superfamily N-acetyltransferase